ncbi:hypothetical protein [Caballeronia sp. AZ10_KS36]|uniref:hypothetical protein n=1 Tax=Caballeronia sp. AZ10_KS36 TaxID=2921757 RepID=UPI002029530D|nr:hypothetical protein [Caballeronia sp. AZ10_KS36]
MNKYETQAAKFLADIADDQYIASVTLIGSTVVVQGRSDLDAETFASAVRGMIERNKPVEKSDHQLDQHLIPALKVCALREHNGEKLQGVAVSVSDLADAIAKVSDDRCEVNHQRLKDKLIALGATKQFDPVCRTFYFWPNTTIEGFRRFLDFVRVTATA